MSQSSGKSLVLRSTLKDWFPWNRWHAKEDYQKDLLFVAVVGSAVFYFTALAYFSPLDPSFTSGSFPRTKTTNVTGELGANLSALAFYFMGIAAYILPLPGILGTLFLVAKVDRKQSRARYLGWIFAILCTSVIGANHFSPLIFADYPISSGGLIGDLLSTSLRRNFGPTGEKIVLATMMVTSFMMISKIGIFSHLIAMLKSRIATSYHDLRGMNLTRWRRKKPSSVAINIDSPSETEPLVNVTQDDSPLILPMDFHDQDYSVVQSSRMVPATTTDGALVVEEQDHYVPPPASTFKKSDGKGKSLLNKIELDQTSSLLLSTLSDFGVTGKMIGYQPGPVVTVYEFQPDAGIKQSKILGLIDDLALSLKADSIFIHPVKGKRALGIQVPNSKREMVFLGDLIESAAFQKAESPLTFVMGKSLSGDPVCANLAETPHVLVAGSTGSGKSVGINTLLCSLIMKSSPKDVRLILVDPKMLELSVYEGIPHLMMPVITDPGKANLALRWAVNEMERRYRIMQACAVRNIETFNRFWETADPTRRDEIRVQAEESDIAHLPFVVLVIDELADLMLTAPKEIETIIQRLAQKARASGIHLVLATQRPSVDIITGVIKANLPTRIAFQVVSKHDSRTILDQMGADKLLGKGDMLFQRPGISALERIQGAFVSDEEVVSLVRQVKAQEKASYDAKVMRWIEEEAVRQGEDAGDTSAIEADDDPKWDEAITIAQGQGGISASFLQRQLKIGYNRAARIVETMEKLGLVDKADGAKPRRWLGHRPGLDA